MTGYRVYECEACGTRRRHTYTYSAEGRTATCSKGHAIFYPKPWQTRILEDIMIPGIRAAMESASPLRSLFR
jgi:hypothetical protein